MAPPELKISAKREGIAGALEHRGGAAGADQGAIVVHIDTERGGEQADTAGDDRAPS
jgi:hypothetical protein